MLVFGVLIMLIGVGFLSVSLVEARNKANQKMDTAITAHLDSVSDTLSTINLYLTDTLINNPLCDTVATEKDIHTRNIAARSLIDEFEWQCRFWNGTYNLYFYASTPDVSIHRFDVNENYINCMQLAEQLKTSIRSQEVVNSKHWEIWKVNGVTYLVRLYV